MLVLFRTSARALATALFLCVLAVRSADATPIAAFEYVETPLGGGLFQYDYTLHNLADPIADAGVDAWDLFLTYSGSLVAWATPAGWDLIDGGGFLEAFSTMPGEPPTGADLAPGSTLGGFRFVFDGRVGSLPFEVAFVNPADPANGLLFDGRTTPAAPVDTGTVPEPSTISLLAAGLVGAALLRRRACREGN